jgi:transcriptional regulator with XRE-family HTH domain
MKPIPLVKQVGQAIARQRKIKKLTQAQVAEKLEIEVETVSCMETGSISPTLEGLEQFSQLFDCPVSTFFCSDSQEIHTLTIYLADLMQSLLPNEKSYLVNSINNFVNFIRLNR